MDTREKIISVSQLRAQLHTGQWVVVVGLFDPLTCGQAIRLSSLRKEKLAVVVEPGDAALLPAQARAALLAALRHVDAVAVGTADCLDGVPANVAVVNDPEAERRRSQEFVEFVLQRQSGAAG